MASKHSVEFLIDGKIYRMSGFEEQEYISRLASYINTRLEEFSKSENWRRLPADQRAVMVEMNLADDLFKAKAVLERREEELARVEKDLYETKARLAEFLAKEEEEEPAQPPKAAGEQLSFFEDEKKA